MVKQKAFVAKYNNQTRSCTEVMQIIWPAILDIGESGDLTVFPFFFSRECFIKCKKFEGNFTMAVCSFGGVSDQCGATSWAGHETGMVPLLSCENDMTEWLKEKYEGPGAFGATGRPGHTKATGDSKYQLGIIHAHKCLLSQSSGLLFFFEERP